ncbi:hypothetical protein [uncultured Ilyobacter sp.]|uniref:hypothetical protein n=1 Tax=uncultured Ilyobacter sp. TaxID=544433 RepID=UPI0029C7DF95|nr:hypothetical protein [uncultured Ilyobacter sp.]
MTVKRVDELNGLFQAMLIHENGIVSHRGFTSYEEVVSYRERNKYEKVIIQVGAGL